MTRYTDTDGTTDTDNTRLPEMGPLVLECVSGPILLPKNP